jgi:hypothetical protein
MPNQSDIEKAVRAYIQACYDWEIKALGFSNAVSYDTTRLSFSPADMMNRVKSMTNSGEWESTQLSYQKLLAEYCTEKDRSSEFQMGIPTQHHPLLESITKIQQIDNSHALVFTCFEPPGSYARHRRYHLELHDEKWLIDQHFVLDEDFEDLAEL